MKKILPALLFLIIILGGGNLLYAQAPAISSFSPASGAAGATVTIAGSGFNATVASNIVFFGATKATVNAATTTQLTVTVPIGATYQPLSVLNTATHLTGYSAKPFVYTFSSTFSLTSADLLPGVSFATGNHPDAITIADLDGDGLADVIVANGSSNTVSLFRNTATSGTIGGSTFAAKIDIATSGIPMAVTVADVDGDGKPDLVVVNQVNNIVSVYRNTSGSGSITFAAKVDYITGNMPFAVKAADMDNDGKPDLAVVNFSDNTVSVFKNNSSPGTISFASKVDFPTGLQPSSVTAADFDGDGKTDLAIANFGSSTVSVLHNASAGGVIALAQKVDYTTGLQPAAIAAGDIDGDGNPDIVTADYALAVNTISLLRNASSGGNLSFAGKIDFATGGQPTAVAIGDMDGDGHADIVTSNFNSKTLSVLRNTASSGSISTSSLAAKVDFNTGTAPYALALGDIDGDGRTDIVEANAFDSNFRILQNHPANNAVIFAESTASVSIGSFVNTDLMEQEWKQQAPPGYTVAADDGTTINATGTAGTNAGRFVYFSTAPQSQTVRGNLTFTAKGSGTIDVQIISTWNNAVYASHTFTLTSSYQNYTWAISNLYPNLEYIIAVVFNGGNSSSQASGQFKKNFCLNMEQCGLAGNYTRYRADLSSLIGNSETGWYGWSYYSNAVADKYLQHSAYARMHFQTDATHIVMEYVRDFFDKPLVNLFPINYPTVTADWDSNGNVVSGYNVLNTQIKVTPGTTYTISGLRTTYPSYVWFNNGVAMGPAVSLNNIGSAAAPVYQLTAPPGATNLGLLIMRITDITNYFAPVNDTYQSYANCMIQQGAIGTPSPSGLVVSTPFAPFSGFTATNISGPAIFINGSLYKYYQVEGSDQPNEVQYVADDLPVGMKDIEIMMPGQDASLTPLVNRGGTFLRSVYFPQSNTTESPASTQTTGSICYIHDSILSGFNISSDAQNNVWMMKVKRDPAYGFTGDVFSEGYAGRILHTNTSTPALLSAFATKLASFSVDKYWFQVGVNDYSLKTPLNSFYSEFKALVEQLHTLRPNAKIYIQCIGPVLNTGSNTETIADNGLTPTGPSANDYRDVQRAIATSHSYCEYVDFEDLFPATLANLADGIHPTDAGNTLYANGIKNNSTLLGTTPTASSLAFYSGGSKRAAIRGFIKTVPGISLITASGGTAPYTFSLVSGTLPSGLTFNADGTVTGTPTQSGVFPLSVKVQDAAGANVTQTFNLVVADVPNVVVGPIHILNAVQGTLYTKVLRGALGYGPYILTQTAGSLPPGITFTAATGTLSGTPTTVGTYNFTITAVDHWGFTGHTNYTLTVGTTTPAALSDHFYQTVDISTGNLVVTGHLNDLYSQEFFTYMAGYVTQGGVEYTINAGTALNVEANHLAGTPVNLGAINPANGPVTSVRLFIGAISPASLDGVSIGYDATTIIPLYINATSNVSFTANLLGTLAYGNYTLTETGSLPAGVTFNSATGVLSGTPTATGNTTFSINAVDSWGNSVTTNYTLVVNAPAAFAVMVYDDILENGWADFYSYYTTIDYSNSTYFKGTHSISATYTAAWGAVSLETGTAVNTTGLTSLRLSIYGGPGTTGKSITVVVNQDYTQGHTQTVTLTEGSWSDFTLPLSGFGSPASINQIIIQEGSGNLETVYLDNIGFN